MVKTTASGVPGESVLTAAAVLLAISSPFLFHPSSVRRSDPVAAALAKLPHRPSAARLNVESRHRSYMRAFTPEVAIALDETLEAHPLPDPLDRFHAAGVSRLLRGDAAGAVRHLSKAVALSESEAIGAAHRAAILNDLAVAYFESHQGKNLVIGLDSAERAWQLHRSPAIAWTRAVLLSSLASPAVASKAWDEYLTLDSSSPWADEARRERNSLSQATWPLHDAPTLTVRGARADSAALEEFDRVIKELSRRGRHDAAAAVLLSRAETLDAMLASDEAWTDRVKARMVASGETSVARRAIEEIAVAAARDGYAYAARALSVGSSPTPEYARVGDSRLTVLLADMRISESHPARGAVDAVLAAHARALYELDARIEIANGSSQGALWMSDRARTVGASPQDRSSCLGTDHRASADVMGERLVRCIPAGVTVVHQDLDTEAIHTWVIRDGRTVFKSTPVPAIRVRAEIERLRDAIQSDADETSLRTARYLYDLLLRPVEKELGDTGVLVYSPSSQLSGVPVGVLHDGTRFLVERRVITTTRTISTFVLSKPISVSGSALVVLPSASAKSKELRGARQEALEVDALYGRRGVLLTDERATPETFLRDVIACDVLHVATHGHTSELPYQNAIQFGSRRLRAYELLHLRLDRRPVVMLAACSTATDSGSPSNISLADAFITAGASTVIGSLWDVRDSDTAELSIEFHRELSRGVAPQVALRNAQLTLMRRGMPIASWGAFQVRS